ncbi:PREDICTED: lactase-phlorizin hydrolase-like [Papilio xuthus]|uniref:beta-glucosidase n=1 Tax=Papilio xuthus TaxID=66420 RepID=A0AAJ7E9H9_PAPXU|nr:PREDICTED: lactase-phlorizin hydrolase-like [Papilio xuthus]
MAGVHFLLLVSASVFIADGKIINHVRHEVRKFPDNFLFGTATASYQVEGAWNEDGKAESIWDHITHENPCVTKDCLNGDIADDSYHQYKRDVEMMRELGLDYYRFSLSWPRILPNSFPDKINEAGVQYYNNLIDEMLKYNIKPMITLYHWDLPQKLQEMGGWTNPYIIDWYSDYARVAFELFGDRVKDWITINEPHPVCYYGYGDKAMAPLLNIKGVADYMCTKNLLLAHAKAYHIYDKEFRPTQGGKIFIALSAQWYDAEHEEFSVAAQEANDFSWAIYSHPIFSATGDFPKSLKETVAAKSAAQGYPRSRLPEFTQEEIEYIRGTSDYFGLNHYSTKYVYRNESVVNYYESPSFEDDLGVIMYTYDDWKIGESDFTKFVPWGFYKLLTKIREDYGNPSVIITENGFATLGGLNDDDRITYYKHYMNAMLDAMEDGSDVQAYTAWSLMDNFEWLQGYTQRFGLYEVDYESPERTRTPRKSAFYYKQILRTRELDMHYEPDTDVMTIDEGHCYAMAGLQLLFLLTASLVIIESKIINEVRHEVRKFPDNFLFGTATASYQVEGAWDEDGKTESIWDHVTHENPCVTTDCLNGDIADNSYHLYKRDVEMMRELGLDHYRFSLSWPRILPTSFPDKINEAGVQYYNNLIDEMLKYNIKPMVTLYHWDLPQKLQEMGGWTNPNIIDWYSDYVRVAFELFGDRVKHWITINEAHAVCYAGYGDNALAPLLNIKGVADYMCTKNLLLAHAKAYHIYDEEFRPTQGGSIFMSIIAQYYDTEHEEFAQAAEEANDFSWGLYSHPIFSETGDFPKSLKERVAAKSAEQGFPRSRLPEFTQEEIDYIRGTSDYFGLNHYYTSFVYRNESTMNYYESPSFDDDLGVVMYTYDDWIIGESDFTKFVPWGYYKLLTKIREDYGNPPIIITENGFASHGGLNDDDRIKYYRHHLSAVLDAIEDGSDIQGYTAWSLMDNFEWLRGYTERFGLYEVDYESPERTRTPRKSAFVYKQILRTRELDMHYEPDTDVMTIDEGH